MRYLFFKLKSCNSAVLIVAGNHHGRPSPLANILPDTSVDNSPKQAVPATTLGQVVPASSPRPVPVRGPPRHPRPHHHRRDEAEGKEPPSGCDIVSRAHPCLYGVATLVKAPFFGTSCCVHIACSTIAPRKSPHSSCVTAFFHLTPMISPGTPPAILLNIYKRPGTGALSHPAWQAAG